MRSAVLIDISPQAAAGACVHYQEGALPTLVYAKRVAAEPRSGEGPERAVERALETLAALLVAEGGPALLRATGSGTAHGIVVSIDAPWQSAALSTEELSRDRPFLFTRELLLERLAARPAFAGMALVDESLVGATLNGYEVPAPFGKQASQATALVLISLIPRNVAEMLARVLRRAYHTKEIFLIAGTSMRYQAVRLAFPIERDCLVVDSSSNDTTVALVRHGLLAAFSSGALGATLAAAAQRYPLPPLVFLVARGASVPAAREFEPFWPAAKPPKFLALGAAQLNGLLRNATDGAVSADLALLTLYAGAAAHAAL